MNRHFRTFLREAAATLFVAVLLFSVLAVGNCVGAVS